MDDDKASAEQIDDVLKDDTGSNLDDTVREAFEALSADPEGEEETTEQVDETEQADSGADDGDESEEIDATPSEDVGDESEEKPEEPEPETPAIVFPDTFSPAEKLVFQSMPREAQEALVRREFDRDADYTRKSQDAAEHRKTAEAFSTVTAPYSAYLASLGATPEQVVGAMLRAEHTLRMGTPEQKRTALARLAKDYSIDLDGLEIPDVETENPETVDLRNRVDRLDNRFNAEDQRRAQSQTHTANQAITAFVEAKDDAGSLKYPHFNQARDRMGVLMQADESLTMEAAYENALWSDPTLRKSMLDEQQAAVKRDAEAKAKVDREKDSKERAAKAKKALKAAAGVKSASEPVGQGDPASLDLRAQVAKTFESLSSSA